MALVHTPFPSTKRKKGGDRLFDKFIDRTFKTTSGHKAIFSPTKGGSNTNWQNHILIVGLDLTYADGRKETYDVSAGIIQEISTSRKSPSATIKVSSLNKALADLKAEKVKDGDQFYENKKLSFLLNTIQNEVFKDNQQNLPDDKRVSADLLTVKTIDDKMGYWSLSTYPGFDGSSFSPSPNAVPMTAMTTNEDRSIIYVGTGGVSSSTGTLTKADDQTNPPELWQYNIDEDQWTFLATTGSGNNDYRYAPIQHLWYNKNDHSLYGVLWKDFADVKDDIEASANKLKWVCPPHMIFKRSADVSGDSGYLNDATHGETDGNAWTGKWDFRMMYPFDSSVKVGANDRADSAYNSAGNDHIKYDDGETHKTSLGKASVGNFTAYRYMSLPFGPAGQQGWGNTHEPRRATHWMHPQVSGYKSDSRPTNDLFGSVVEKIPTTNSTGVTLWSGTGAATPPTGWTSYGSGTKSLTGTGSAIKFNMDTTTNADGIGVSLSTTNNMTVYKLSLMGDNFILHVSNSSAGTPTHSQSFGPLGMSNSASYSNGNMGNGDYYFSVLTTNAIAGHQNGTSLHLRLTANDHSSNLVMNNISLSIAQHWDHWHNLSRMAAENISLTNYSKVIAGTSIKRPSHQWKNEPAGPQDDASSRTFLHHVGPHSWFYDMFDEGGITARDSVRGSYTGKTSELNTTTGDINIRQPAPFEKAHPQAATGGSPPMAYSGQRNEDLIMEFNSVAQDRRNIASIGAGGVHPLYGPNDLEDGIQPDNSIRHIVGNRNVTPAPSDANHGFDNSHWSNEANIEDIGPRQEATSSEPKGFGSGQSPDAGITGLNASSSFMQKGNQGAGYASVIVQGLGERAHRDDDNSEIYGAVRYTNGTQGAFVFCQEADEGKGVIIYQIFGGTAPSDDSRFRWSPMATTGQAGHFKLAWRYYRCTDKVRGSMSNMPITQRTISAVTPYANTVVPVYASAGCEGEDGKIYVALHESRTHSALYTGSNEDDILNRSYLYKIDLGTGAWSSTAGANVKMYDSSSDASVYNSDMNGVIDNGRFANYAAGSAVNKTRKFLRLHYNKTLSTTVNGTNGLFGTCFKRDSILAEYLDSAPYEPCHEVFVFAGTSNELKILDHDVQNGTTYDAAGFSGFVNTAGKFAHTSAALGTSPGVFYFRTQKTTVGATPRDYIGVGIKLNYLYSPSSGTFKAGGFHDDKSAALTRKIYANEGMLSNGHAVTGILDKGTDSEREAIFGAFDDYISWYHIGQYAKGNLAFGSTKHFFKIDDKEVDPRIPLADFTGLSGFDTFSKLALANNMAFGFDVEKFFLVSRREMEETHTLDARKGEVIDIKKAIDNDIRNVVSIQPFRQQVQDVEWEVTHVGGDDVLADSKIYNGEFTVTPKSHREASVNLICTRQGRLIMNNNDTEDDSTASVVDSITNVGSRMTPLFKWRTHSPTKQVVLMKPTLTTSTDLYVNTTFSAGASPVTKGEIVIFTDQTSFEQIGRVITSVDGPSNKITIEESVGIAFEAGIPLNIVRTHTGSQKTASGNTSTSSYGTKYSDEGVTVITSIDHSNVQHGVCSGGNHSHYTDKTSCQAAGHTWSPVTRVGVNNIRPFADSRITPYSPESYKHYSFLVTTLSTSQLSNVALPQQSDSQFATDTTNAATSILSTQPTSWVKQVDTANAYLYLNGTYTAFEVGDVLNAHYAIAPASIILQTNEGAIQPGPYNSLQQDLPEGLGTWSWKCDNTSDLFNLKDIIQFKFQGIKLVKDSGSIYTISDTASIVKYGQRAWNFPDNRFISHDKVEYWATKFLAEYGDPKYQITVSLPFDPTLTFTTPAGNLLRKVKIIDDIMFPGISGFSVSGYLKENSLNVKNLTMTLKLRTEEKY